ncbi:hypothetical protein MVEN_01792000 [Mycena venus]|uniref:Uncharacterized protein n=1 Tax=Mycena venus TaxID=2733690 RepID=A0A8H6XJ75_9AGAR|nr:hypothetical protein MVEN_01792000 [Mycena venus]
MSFKGAPLLPAVPCCYSCLAAGTCAQLSLVSDPSLGDTMGDDLVQMLSFAFATIVSFSTIGDEVVRCLALIFVFVFLVRYCLMPILPGTRIRVLQSNLEETEGVLRLALSESLRDRIPPFVYQVELDLLCAKLSASHLQSNLLRARKLPWTECLPILWDISLNAVRSQWQVRELQGTIMFAIEGERQRRYNDTIHDKQAAISSLISTGHFSNERRRTADVSIFNYGRC